MRIFCGMATAGNNIFCIMGSWDAKTGKNSSDIFCTKVLNCLDVGGESSALIAAGGSDPILRIWDPCKPGSFNSRLTLLGFRLASGMTTLGFV
ncbi:ribosome biogenesis protein WDR12 homolog [Castanea sativa]|uniref:ribosome biogenesis protein WDR12 homolog n=1 Tax=Castanea sativa TaxID=21020 RepID=UPI003F64F268